MQDFKYQLKISLNISSIKSNKLYLPVTESAVASADSDLSASGRESAELEFYKKY